MGQHLLVVDHQQHVEINGMFDDGGPALDSRGLDPADQLVTGGGPVDERRGQHRPEQWAGDEVGTHLFEDDGGLDRAEAAASRFLGRHQPQHAHGGHLAPGVSVDGRLFPLDQAVQREPVREEPVDGLLQLDLTGIQAELHHVPS